MTNDNPSVFYVIAKNPNTPDTIYQEFLQSLTPTSTSGLVEPAPEFKNRITKKPFGILIDPQTSPVQPEKFSGYHTGVDIEFEDVNNAVPVVAVADGRVLNSTQAEGYGGVVTIQHTINNQNIIGIYGHLKIDSLPKVGAIISAGEQIGTLGEGGSKDTDGERKHLHFGLGKTNDIKGYVNSKKELEQWFDPVIFF